ncbi:hypothetical protein J3A83DRAFT_4375592 [Scleroderma citrinum]
MRTQLDAIELSRSFRTPKKLIGFPADGKCGSYWMVEERLIAHFAAAWDFAPILPFQLPESPACGSGGTMDSELAQARSELDLLEQQEQYHLRQLYVVRNAIQMQKTRIKGIVGQRVAPISRLPNEVLLRIFDLAIGANRSGCDVHDVHDDRNVLMAVSRLWRALVQNSPQFWTYIRLIGIAKCSASFVQTHIDRSGQYPLDIEIAGWYNPSWRPVDLGNLLDIVLPHAYRWRSLVFSGMSEECALLALGRLDLAAFPSLVHVNMAHFPGTNAPYNCQFLRPENVPRLESLELHGVTVWNDLNPSPSLTKLILSFSNGGPPLFLLSSSLRRLKYLSLEGFTQTWQLQQNSIHLPLLEHLVCKVSHPGELLRAFSVPGLIRFDCSDSLEPTSSVFATLPPGLFASVRYLSINFARNKEVNPCVRVMDLCLAFPSVRHAVLDAHDISEFFCVESGSYPADHWDQLGILTIQGHYLSPQLSEIHYYLTPWIQKQRDWGPLSLRIEFPSSNLSEIDEDLLITFYTSLRELCSLEVVLKDVSFQHSVVISGVENDSLQLSLVRGLLISCTNINLEFPSTDDLYD